MIELDATFTNQQGHSFRRKVVASDESTVGQLATKFQEKGWTLTQVARRRPVTTTTTPVTKTLGQRLTSPEVLSMAGQVGLPAAAALAAPETGGLSLAALGLAGGLGGAALSRRGLPTLGDVGTTVAGEATVPGGRLALRGARAVAPQTTARIAELPKLLGQGMSRLAERAGIRLTPGETFPGGLLRQGIPASERLEGEQAAQVTGAVVREAGAAGAKSSSLPKFLDLWHDTIAQLPEDRSGPVLAEVRRVLGMDASKLTVPTLQKLIRNRDIGPAGVVSALRSLGVPNAEGRMAEVWWGDLLQTAAREARPGSRMFPELYKGAGGTFFMDGNAIVRAFKGLTPASTAAFGAQRRQAISDLVAVLERARGAQRALPRVTGAPVSGKAGIVPMNTIMAALKDAIRRHPYMVSLFGLGEAEALLGPRTQGHRFEAARDVGALVGGVIVGRQVGRRILSRVLSTDVGMRWVAAGIEMQNRGLPAQAVIAGLSRIAGQTLARGAGGAMQAPGGPQP